MDFNLFARPGASMKFMHQGVSVNVCVEQLDTIRRALSRVYGSVFWLQRHPQPAVKGFSPLTLSPLLLQSPRFLLPS